MPPSAFNAPRLSMVIPAFRAGETIERTLVSILEQDYPNLQLIVMDGGSQDGTVDILRRYDAHIDYWVSEKDKCQADALNKGFARADGDLHGWLCADDALLPGALDRLVDHLQRHPEIDVVTGGCKRDFNGRSQVFTEPAPDFFERLDFTNTIEQPSTVWRAAAHARAGALDLTYRYAFDWEFWCRLKKTGARFGRITDPVSVYYFSDDNLTSSGGTRIAEEMYRVIKTYGPYGGQIADVYRYLYYTFDLKGYYDQGVDHGIPGWKRGIFHAVLRYFYTRYDQATVNAYNWNFASRQERGLGWG